MKSNIKKLRKQKNISQKMLGDAIGLSQQVISRMECDRSKIQVDVLMKLAEYFQVSTDCILGYDGETKTDLFAENALRSGRPSGREINAVIERLEQLDKDDRMVVWGLLAKLKPYL